MALAILEHEGPRGGGQRFRAEIGTNSYWRWVVGDGRRPHREHGFDLLADPSHEGPVSGPLPPEARGRTVIEVPAHVFEGDNKHVQLLSFRERDMSGPAASQILRMTGGTMLDSDGVPAAIQLSLGRPEVRLVQCYGEQRPVSTTMFIGALAGILPALAPILSAVGPMLAQAAPGLLSAAAPALQQLLASLSPPARPAAAGGPPAPRPAPAPQLQIPRELLELIQRLTAPQGAVPAAPAAAAPAPPPVAPRGEAASLSTQANLSQAFIAPALLAALPALMPLLQQVLTPETMKSIIGIADPNKLIGTVTEGIGNLAQIGLQGQAQLQQHLERLNPGTETPDVERLMAAMSMSPELGRNISRRRPAPSYRRIRQVTLHFAELTQATINGREQTCFLTGQELQFPLTVETPRPIAKATLRMEIKHAGTHRRAAARSWPLRDVRTGRVDPMPSLSKEEAAALKPGHEYLVTMSLVWKGKEGRRLGTAMTQLITIVGRYTFDSVEQSTQVIPLNDVEADREYWHKAWQGSFEKDRRKVVLNCRYQYALDPKATSNAQMETETELEPSSVAHETGTMRSGLVAGGYALNKLMGRIAQRPPLNADELAALATPEFVDRFSQAARTRVTFRGRPGDSAALWVYPEVKVQEVVLQEAAEVAPSGNVQQLAEHRVSFPFFVLAHFIGVSSQ